MTPAELLLAAAEMCPEATFPAGFIGPAIREVMAGGAHRPPAGEDWTVVALAAEFRHDTSWVIRRINRGAFGTPGAPGGPYRESDSATSPWLVPDACVREFRAERRRRQQAPQPVPDISPPTPVEPPRGGGIAAMVAARGGR